MYRKLDEFRRIVTLEGQKLLECHILADGRVDMAYGQLNWLEVKAPESQAFLDAVNEALGTAFRMEQFEEA